MLPLPLLLAALGAPGAGGLVVLAGHRWLLAGHQRLPGGAGGPVPDATGVRGPSGTPRGRLPGGGTLGDTWGQAGAGAERGQRVGTAAAPAPAALPAAAQEGVATADRLAQVLNGDSGWGQRLRQRRRLCLELPRRVWPPLTAPPQLQIVPERSGPALTLVCHAWGFSPADITLKWLRNGDIIGDIVGDIIGDTVGDTSGQSRALPVGDGTFRAQVTIQVPPGTSGDTLECLALHPSLKEPLRVAWAPGLSPNLSLMVALAVLGLLLGLLLFTFGLCRYLRPGYTPLPGETYAGYAPLPGDT